MKIQQVPCCRSNYGVPGSTVFPNIGHPNPAKRWVWPWRKHQGQSWSVTDGDGQCVGCKQTNTRSIQLGIQFCLEILTVELFIRSDQNSKPIVAWNPISSWVQSRVGCLIPDSDCVDSVTFHFVSVLNSMEPQIIDRLNSMFDFDHSCRSTVSHFECCLQRHVCWLNHHLFACGVNQLPRSTKYHVLLSLEPSLHRWVWRCSKPPKHQVPGP